MKGRRNLFAALLLFSALILTAPAAFATTITAQWTGWGGAVLSDGVRYGYATGVINPIPGGGAGSVGLGGDQFHTTTAVPFADAKGNFNGWCVDINAWLVTTSRFVVGTETDLVNRFSRSRVDDLLALADERYSSLDSQQDSAAFQQAVWAIMFGTPDAGTGNYRLQSSTFWASSANAGYAEANRWLSELDTATRTADYDLTYLMPNPAGSSQAIVVFTPAPVPEPGTLLLLGTGLCAIFGVVRRRHRRMR